MRIRGGVVPKKNMKVIDLTETRRLFYEGFQKAIDETSNARVSELVADKEFDLRVDYKRREDLPDEVRPKPKPSQQARGGGYPGAAPQQNPSMFYIGE